MSSCVLDEMKWTFNLSEMVRVYNKLAKGHKNKRAEQFV